MNDMEKYSYVLAIENKDAELTILRALKSPLDMTPEQRKILLHAHSNVRKTVAKATGAAP